MGDKRYPAPMEGGRPYVAYCAGYWFDRSKFGRVLEARGWLRDEVISEVMIYYCESNTERKYMAGEKVSLSMAALWAIGHIARRYRTKKHRQREIPASEIAASKQYGGEADKIANVFVERVDYFEKMHDAMLAKELRAAIEKLPDAQRRVMHRLADGASLRKVAEECGISHQNVSDIRSRTADVLRDRLRRFWVTA